MKLAFFTEMGFSGKVSRDHKNMRTEFAWMATLNADHYNIQQTPDEHYDLGIVINSKNNPQHIDVPRYKTKCKQVGVMQEGPFWYFQDYSLTNQVHYYNNLVSADIIFTHNETDVSYFKGLTNHPDVRVLPSLMVEDPIDTNKLAKDRSGIMIGGNMKSWYGGFDSFTLASSVTDEIYQPQMGRRSEGEAQLGIKQLPYMEWTDWITELSKRRIGIHMMRTHAAGTFALNCSYLGVPCIGYEGLDTQRILHPNLTVKDGDLSKARALTYKLWNDLEFYKQNSILTKQLYKQNYHENKFNTTFQEQSQIS